MSGHSKGRPIGRRLGVLVVSAVAATTLTAVASPAPASATYQAGCTRAPGYVGAHNCISLSRNKLKVTTSRSTYMVGFNTLPDQLCNRKHQWRYKKQGAAKTKTKTINGKGCNLGYLNSYAVWKKPGKMKNGSQFCARSKNSHTGGKWTAYACKKIKK